MEGGLSLFLSLSFGMARCGKREGRGAKRVKRRVRVREGRFLYLCVCEGRGWKGKKKSERKKKKQGLPFPQSTPPFPAKLAPPRPRSLYPPHQKKMQTSLCRSANMACAARPSRPAGARAAARSSVRSSVVVRAEGEVAPAKWAPPALDANTPSPTFGGSTGGLLRKAQVR